MKAVFLCLPCSFWWFIPLLQTWFHLIWVFIRNPKGGITTGLMDLVLRVTASVQTWMVCQAGLQVRSIHSFASSPCSLRLPYTASTMLCRLAGTYLTSPILGLTFLPSARAKFLPDIVTRQEKKSVAMIVFWFPWEASSTLAAANKRHILIALFSCFICPR